MGDPRGVHPDWKLHALTRERDDLLTEVRQLRDEVFRLAAVIDNPGDLDLTFSTTGLDKMHLAHAETVKVTITSHTIRDHLRAKLESP